MTVCVYSDSSFSSKITLYGIFAINLALSNSGSLTGNLPQNTVNGCATIPDLKVNGPGAFDLSATNSFADSFTYSNLNIEKLTITIESSSIPTALFDHTLDVKIKASSGNFYLSLVNVVLSADDSVISSNSCSTNSGLCQFQLYFVILDLKQFLLLAQDTLLVLL